MAFVVPAEIGHAPYAAPVLEYLVKRFEHVHVIAVRTKLFPELSEDCWLLYADGYGGQTEEIALSICHRFEPDGSRPKPTLTVRVSDWQRHWNKRLRSFLMPEAARTLYRLVATDEASFRLSDVASTGIGYVSGANDFFHLRPSEAERWNISCEYLLPSVRNGRVLPRRQLTNATVEAWRKADEPVLLLKLPKADRLPGAVQNYLNTDEGKLAREAYKCRSRDPWWSVPDVRIPDYFLSYMSSTSPNLVHNTAGVTCTNSVHAVRAVDAGKMLHVAAMWDSPFVQLSCEIEGHPLGGGMLKLEPREAGRVLFASPTLQAAMHPDVIEEALAVVRAWRHHA